MIIKFINAATYFKNLPHQVEAWEYLQNNVSSSVLEEFARIYRNQPKFSQVSRLIPRQALDLIKEFEGFSSKAYYDPLSGGLPITIGYGSTKRKDGSSFLIGDTVTEKEAENLLEYQLAKDYLPSLSKIPYWNDMNDNQKSALLSFAYNLGSNFYDGYGFQTITRHLKNKEWKNVPDAMMLYVNPGTSVEAGLRRRRIAEGKMWEGLS